jgi:tryptophan synthase alpha chain
MNRIDRAFRDARASRRALFSIYLCAGDPDLDTTRDLVLEFAHQGVDMVELGVPFSDPVADGPVIQNASQRALKAGTTLRKTLALVRQIRQTCPMPICLMTYYNPVHRYGEALLAEDAVLAGVDGLIIPDLIPEEAADLSRAARQHDLKTVFFVAPTSTDDRIRLADQASTGFIYCVSVTGITGARAGLPPDLADHLRRIRSLTTHPLVVGFGVSQATQVSWIASHADGVIVGSAMVRHIEDHLAGPRAALVQAAGRFAAELASGVRTS